MKSLKSIAVTAMLLMATVATKATPPTVGMFLENESERCFRLEILQGSGVIYYFVVEVDGTPFHFNENLMITNYYTFTLPQGEEYVLTHARTTEQEECTIHPDHQIIKIGGVVVNVNLDLPIHICENHHKINLDDKLSSNVPYSRRWYEGDGVIDDHFFDPSLAEEGLKNITVRIEYAGQEYGHTAYIEVWDMPKVSLWLPSEVFVNESPFVLSGGRPYGGSYSTDLGDYCIVNGNTFDPGRAGVGWHNVYYTYTTTAGCQDVAHGRIYVRAVGFGVEENLDDTGVSVYPNPTTGMVNFGVHVDDSESYTSEPCSVDVFSVYGVLVLRNNSLQEGVDLSSLPAGIYLLRLYNGNDRFSRTIIKR